MHSTNVSSKHLKQQTQFRLTVKNELVATKGYVDSVSVFGASTLHVAQQSSSFSNLNTVEVLVSVGLFDTGIASGLFPVPQVYNTIGLVLKNEEQD